MEIEDIVHTRQTGAPLHGLEPPMDLHSHAVAAMHMHMRWTTNSQGGRPVYTRSLRQIRL